MAGEELLIQAGQNFRGAGETAIAGEKSKTAAQEVQQQPGMEASRELTQRAIAEKDNQTRMQIEQLKYKMGETNFPAELAIQMSKDFGDPNMLHMSGIPMNNRLMGAWIAEKYKGMAKTNAPKITEIATPDGKVTKAVTWRDMDGTVQTIPIGSPIAPEKIHPGGGKKTGSGGGSIPMDFRNEEAFKRSYEKVKASYSDPIKAEEKKKIDPEGYQKDQQFLSDYADRYDTIIKKQSGGGKAPEASGGTKNEAPFDPDAFIKEAVGG